MITRSIVLILVVATVLTGVIMVFYGSHVYPNTYVEEVKISGMTKQEALCQVEALLTTLLLRQPLLQIENFSARFSWKQLGVQIEAYQIVQQIFADNQGSLLTQILSLAHRLVGEKRYYIQATSINKRQLEQQLANEVTLVLVQPQNARIDIVDQKVIYIDGTMGKGVNVDQAANRILRAFNLREHIIKLPLSAVDPEVELADIKAMGIKEVVGEYSTLFDSNNEERSNNLELCAETIDDVVIAPNDIFNFNKIVGVATPEKGYQKAAIYVDGDIVVDYGGGKCQVSSTLYNAAILANLRVLERHPHSMPVSYVPPSQDAAVSYGGVNLILENSLQHHIYINTVVETGRLTIRIYSTDDNLDVEVKHEILAYVNPETIGIVDPSLGVGEVKVEHSGKPGIDSRAFKIIKKDGIIISQELLSQDSYAPISRRIKYNPIG